MSSLEDEKEPLTLPELAVEAVIAAPQFTIGAVVGIIEEKIDNGEPLNNDDLYYINQIVNTVARRPISIEQKHPPLRSLAIVLNGRINQMSTDPNIQQITEYIASNCHAYTEGVATRIIDIY